MDDIGRDWTILDDFGQARPIPSWTILDNFGRFWTLDDFGQVVVHLGLDDIGLDWTTVDDIGPVIVLDDFGRFWPRFTSKKINPMVLDDIVLLWRTMVVQYRPISSNIVQYRPESSTIVLDDPNSLGLDPIVQYRPISSFGGL